jgi:hypothetical protein
MVAPRIGLFEAMVRCDTYETSDPWRGLPVFSAWTSRRLATAALPARLIDAEPV